MSLFSNLFGAIQEVFKAFRKTPEERERERIKDRTAKIIENAGDTIDAINKAQTGDTDDLERILSGMP